MDTIPWAVGGWKRVYSERVGISSCCLCSRGGKWDSEADWGHGAHVSSQVGMACFYGRPSPSLWETSAASWRASAGSVRWWPLFHQKIRWFFQIWTWALLENRDVGSFRSSAAHRFFRDDGSWYAGDRRSKLYSEEDGSFSSKHTPSSAIRSPVDEKSSDTPSHFRRHCRRASSSTAWRHTIQRWETSRSNPRVARLCKSRLENQKNPIVKKPFSSCHCVVWVSDKGSEVKSPKSKGCKDRSQANTGWMMNDEWRKQLYEK